MNVISGVIKYLKLNVLKSYIYQALNIHDVEEQKEKINKMLEEIKNYGRN